MKKILLLFTILTTLTCIGCSKEETMQMSISDSVSESSEENFDTSATVQQLFSEAVTKDNYEMAKWALLNGADVNKFANYEYISEEENPLMVSISNSNEKMAMLLLKNGADVDYVDENGMTTLMCAVTNRMYDVCEELIDRNVDKNALDASGDNCIDYAITYMGDGYVSDKEMLKMAKLLYNDGVKISNNTKRHIVASDGEGVMDYEYVALDWLISIGEIKREDLNENQEVFYNVYLGNLDYIKKLKKTQLKIKNSQNQDLLTVAITYAKKDIAKYLLENGMWYKENSTELSDAIGYAALCGDLDTLKMIYKYTDLSDSDIYTIISYGMQCSNDEYIEGIEYLVSKMSDINTYIDNPNETILCLAVYNDLEKTSKMLIEHGAEVNLHIIYNAENVGNSELMKLLLDNFDIESINEEERQNLLYKMIEVGDYEIAKYLIDKGVSIGKDSKKYLEDCPIPKMKSLLEK